MNYLKAIDFPRMLKVIWPLGCFSTSLIPSSSWLFCNSEGIWLVLSVSSIDLSSSTFFSSFSSPSLLLSDSSFLSLLSSSVGSSLMLSLSSSSTWFSPSFFSSPFPFSWKWFYLWKQPKTHRIPNTCMHNQTSSSFS